MKKIILSVAVMALLLPGLVGIALAQTPTGIGAQVLKHDPAPAEAGKFLELWVSVTKTGNNNLNNYGIEILPEFPFFLASNEDAKREYSVIDTNGLVARFELRVAEDAPNGDATLKLKHGPLASDATSGFVELVIPILSKVDISVEDVKPDTLIPGQPTDVKIVFENSGEAPVRDLIVTWSDPEEKILPLASENRFRIENLGIGQRTQVTFPMIADPTVVQGVHVIDLNMEFQRFGVSENRTSKIAFIVGGLTDFDVAQDEFDGETLSLSVANVGVNTATGVLLSVPVQDGWTVVGGNEVFLGNLEPGDFTVASVDVTPDSLGSSQDIDVNVRYTDTVGIRQTSEKELKINLAGIVVAEGDSGSSSMIIIVAIVVVAVGFFFANRKFKILKKLKR